MPRAERPDMAAYGVTDDPTGLLPWDWAEERLAASRNFWLVTADRSARPHAMPVWGVWMPDRERFGFSCAPQARKVRNLAENPRVVVTNEDTVHVVSIEGVAHRLDDHDVERMARAWFAKYADEPGFDNEDVAVEFVKQAAAYEIEPERAFGLIEEPDQFAERATRWVWD